MTELLKFIRDSIYERSLSQVLIFTLCPFVELPDWDFHRLEDRATIGLHSNCWLNAPLDDFQNPEHHPKWDLIREQLAHKVSVLPEDLIERHNDSTLTISEHILILKIIGLTPSPDYIPLIVDVFLKSRVGILPEDPDLFERATFLLSQHVRQFPNEWEIYRQEELPRAVFSNSLGYINHSWHHLLSTDTRIELSTWAERNASQTEDIVLSLHQDIEAAWEKDNTNWIESWRSDQGSIGSNVLHLSLWYWTQKIPNSSKLSALSSDIRNAYGLSKKPSILRPLFRPSYYEKRPQPAHHLELPRVFDANKYSWSWTLTLLGLGLLGWSVRRSPRIAALCFGLFFIISLECSFRVLQIPSLSSTHPLFSFKDWQYQLFHPKENSHILQSVGGPSRYQWVDQSQIPDFRIGIVGASSAHGSNLLMEDTFGSILESNLQQVYPSKSIQVLNGAIGGTTSNGVLGAGREIIDLGVDALIIYYGHNEAPQFSNLALYQTVDESRLKWRIFLSNNRIYSVLYRLLGTPKAIHPTAGSIYRTQPLLLNEQIKLRKLAVLNMRHNIQQLIDHAAMKTVDVTLLNPSFHFRFAPTEAFDIPASEVAKAKLEEAEISAGSSDLALRLSLAQEAEDLAEDGSLTDIQARHLIINLLSDLSQFKSARESFYSLLDISSGITTITSDIRSLNLQLATENGLGYLDLESLFYKNSKDGLSANGLFWDELHPSTEGHQRIADSLFPYFRDLIALQSSEKPNSLDKAPNP